MKMRIKGNSVRFRLTQSEVASLVESGRIADTIHFATDNSARITFGIQVEDVPADARINFTPTRVIVFIDRNQVQDWFGSDRVGIYAAVDLGSKGKLDILIEKDFACLDLSDAANEDTFPNPNAGALC